jgi:hypothetical protein
MYRFSREIAFFKWFLHNTHDIANLYEKTNLDECIQRKVRNFRKQKEKLSFLKASNLSLQILNFDLKSITSSKILKFWI